jgi:hypothetical protein
MQVSSDALGPVQYYMSLAGPTGQHPHQLTPTAAAHTVVESRGVSVIECIGANSVSLVIC